MTEPSTAPFAPFSLFAGAPQGRFYLARRPARSRRSAAAVRLTMVMPPDTIAYADCIRGASFETPAMAGSSG